MAIHIHLVIDQIADNRVEGRWSWITKGTASREEFRGNNQFRRVQRCLVERYLRPTDVSTVCSLDRADLNHTRSVVIAHNAGDAATVIPEGL
jgi:hypothetical protein